jgi:hypothetical protein
LRVDCLLIANLFGDGVELAGALLFELFHLALHFAKFGF